MRRDVKAKNPAGLTESFGALWGVQVSQREEIALNNVLFVFVVFIKLL